MRIAHITDCYVPRMGGIERQVHDLAVRQAAAGHEVQIVTCVPGDPVEDGLVVHRPQDGGTAGAIRYFTAPGMARRFDPSRYDVVHAHVSTISPLAWFSLGRAVRAGIPAAATLHSMMPNGVPFLTAADLGTGWRDWPVAWSAVSRVAAKPLEKVLADPVAVVPNGVDPTAWHVLTRPRSPERVVVVSTMRLSVRKRPRALVRTMAEVRAALPSSVALELVIIGDGPQRSRLEREIARLGIADWTTITGRLTAEQIRQVYSDADVYVAPATLESFGIAALEARCAGLPVVAQARSGIADFVVDGQDGLLADGDRAMAQALARLAGDPALRSAMHRHNRDTLPPVTWRDSLAACTALYQTALQRAGRAGRLAAAS